MDSVTRAETFRAIYEANYARILGYALRRTTTADDAVDVVAETFLSAWRRFDDIPGGEEARLWLYGVARHVLANQRRGQRRYVRLAVRLRDELAALPQRATEASGELAGVVDAMASLSAEDRELLRLVAWEALSLDEIATVLGCSPNAAKIRVHRARKRLASRLAVTTGVKRIERSGHEPTGRSPRPAMEEDR